MFHCKKKPVSEETRNSSLNLNPNCKPPVVHKPVVLANQRYERILGNAFQSDKTRSQKESEEEQKYREYLKKGSDELIAQFGPNFNAHLEVVVDAEKELGEARSHFNQSKENEEQLRRERIAKSYQMIEKLKPGPRELQSAAMHCEVLRARNVQRNINAEFEMAIKKHGLIERPACKKPTAPDAVDQEQRDNVSRQNVNKYKEELMQTIKENSKQKIELRKQTIQKQLAERAAVDAEIKAQIEKEKAVMEKKRVALRMNALEAMQMVEQRRMRERMTEEIDDRLCCNFNVGKRQLNAMQKEQAKQKVSEREKIAEVNKKRLASLQQKKDTQEEERIQRDISRMQLKFTAEEAEKKRKEKAAKQARIEAYLHELKNAKEVQRRADEEKRFQIAQRFKNAEVNCMFERAVKQEREQKVQELRAEQKKDFKPKGFNNKKVPEVDCTQQRFDRDDKFFFDYARSLIEDAERKQRPLQPLAKVVNGYKMRNQIDCNRQQPRHLASQFNIGLQRQMGNKQAQPLSSDKEKIMENCLKINEILAAGKGNDNNKERERSCVVNRFKTDQYAPGRSVTKKNCTDGLNAKDAQSRWDKLQRYTIHELRAFNQFSS